MANEIAPPQPILPEFPKPRRKAATLARVCAWGGAAVLSLCALAFVTETEIGSVRLQRAIARVTLSEQDVAKVNIPPPAPTNDAETRRLERQLAALASDRDKLVARLASLERNLEDTTGSIKKQVAEIPRAPPAPIIAPLAMPAATGTVASWSGEAPAQTPPTATPEVGPITHNVPMPPIPMAAAPATETADEPRKSELGLDLGGASTMEILHARWVAVKANFGPLLGGLHPLAAHDTRPGMLPYRLLVGPVPNAATAANLCSRFAASKVNCRSTRFDGEKFAQKD
ncbi:MAG: hypothetical protein ABI830_03795 [Pseudolabrys sp.]